MLALSLRHPGRTVSVVVDRNDAGDGTTGEGRCDATAPGFGPCAELEPYPCGCGRHDIRPFVQAAWQAENAHWQPACLLEHIAGSMAAVAEERGRARELIDQLTAERAAAQRVARDLYAELGRLDPDHPTRNSWERLMLLQRETGPSQDRPETGAAGLDRYIDRMIAQRDQARTIAQAMLREATFEGSAAIDWKRSPLWCSTHDEWLPCRGREDCRGI